MDGQSTLDAPQVPAPSDAEPAAQPVTTDRHEHRDAGRPKDRRLKRRRYWPIVPAAVLGLGLGVLIGYLTCERLYRSAAHIEVLATHRAWSPTATERQKTPTFEAFIESQLGLLRSSDVLVRATQSERWKAFETKPIRGIVKLRKRLEVARARGTQTQIEVAYADVDANDARTVVQCVLDAYIQAHDLETHQDRQQQSREVSQHLAVYRQQRDDLELQQAQLTHGRGAVPIEQLQQTKTHQLVRLEALLRAVQQALDKIALKNNTAAEVLTDRAISRLADADENLRALSQQRRSLKQQLTQLRTHIGINAPQMVQLRSDMKQVDTAIHDRVRRIGRDLIDDRGTAANQRAAGLTTFQDLAVREGALLRAHDELRLELTELRKLRSQADALQERRAMLHRQIAASQLQLQMLSAATPIDRPINIRGPQVPVEPYAAPFWRRLALTGATGMTLGLGFCLLLGLRAPRIGRASNLETQSLLLGTVPAFAPKHSSSHDSDLVALCVHEIRALLQVRAKLDGSKAFAITSPSKGAGKTSLTLALASSLAQSGTPTLLVDCNLTDRMLDGHRTLDESRLPMVETTSPNKAQNQVQNLDEVMLQMGFLSEQDARLFLIPAGRHTGLLGALRGVPLQHCVINTNIRGLDVLPALSAQARDVGKLSSASIRHLIDQAKETYDVILFDTGPIPGSVEAMFVASEADSVIMVVARGESQARFERALRYLRSLGGRLAGTVLNRSVTKDVSIVLTKTSQRASTTPEQAELQERTSAVALTAGSGLLAAAVQAQARPGEAGDSSAGPIDNASDAVPATGAAATASNENSDADAQTMQQKIIHDLRPTRLGQVIDPQSSDRCENDLDQQIDELFSELSAGDEKTEEESIEQIQELLDETANNLRKAPRPSETAHGGDS